MPTNIDNVLIQGVPTVTTTEELREWLLNRNLPNVITEDGFQQNIEMFEESSLLFEESNNALFQSSIVSNTFFQTGFYYDAGVNLGANSGPIYSDTNLGELNIDTVTNVVGDQMPHIECELPPYIFPIVASSLCEINLFSSEQEYTANGQDYYNVPTSDGTPVSDMYNPDNFTKLPPSQARNTYNNFTALNQYGFNSLDIITRTQAQNPADNPYSWFMNNPTMYDLFISPDFDGNFMRFDATALELTRLDQHFYGLKIDQRGFEFNNASAPDGSGIKTFYTPLQPYNQGSSEAPSTLIQNTRILEQFILGSYGSRITRDALLLRNKFASDNMYLSNRFGVGGIDSIEGAVSLNNDYLSLAWVQSGPRKPKSNTNYFVAQLNLANLDPTRLAGSLSDPVIDPNFGQDRALVQEFDISDRYKNIESAETWVPDQFREPGSYPQDIGNQGLLNYTQRIVNLSSSGTTATNTNVGDSIRQDTSYLKTARGTVSRGSGIDSYSNDSNRPYARSWVRTDKYGAKRGERPRNYSRYDALLRHQRLIKESTGWSKGASVISDVGGAHMAPNDRTDTKNFMFSIENLAWKDHALENLASHEIGPNGGRLMWFPPYIESWTENSSANWTQTDFLGRMEPIFTYKNSFRQANLNFMMVTDYPEVLDNIVPDFEGRNADMQAAQFFGGEDFDAKYRDIILEGKPWVGNTEFEGQMNEVINAGEKDASEFLPEITEAVPGNYDTIPTTLYYFSGCTEIGSRTFWNWPYSPDQEFSFECSNCGYLWEGQYQAVTEDTAFKSRGGTAKIGAKTRVNEMAQFLATDHGKRYKVVFTYYKAPVRDYMSMQIQDYQANNGQWFTESLPTETPLSEEAIELVNKDYQTCGPIRAARLLQGFNPLVVAAESATTTTETWYSDEDPPEGRYEIKFGGDSSYDDILLEKLVTSGSTVYPGHIHAIPVTIHLELNNELVSTEAVEAATAEFEQRKTTVRDNYTDAGNYRIPDGTFFEALEQQDLFAYNNYKDNIKNFHPAFHSIHPCAFNSRMTFLNQCLRAGPSLEGTVGPNNMSFGRPPICVLRLGDFYHCKVVINNIDFSYEQPFWDLNPEGIGAQPWIVRVSMQFFIVGGMSLAGPLSQLQNAVSFNYFANTELCEMDRSNPNIGKEKEEEIVIEEQPTGCPCDGTIDGHPAGTTNDACCVEDVEEFDSTGGDQFDSTGGDQFDSTGGDQFDSTGGDEFDSTGADDIEYGLVWEGAIGSVKLTGMYDNGPQDGYFTDNSNIQAGKQFWMAIGLARLENNTWKLVYGFEGGGSIARGQNGVTVSPAAMPPREMFEIVINSDGNECLEAQTAGCTALNDAITYAIQHNESIISGWFNDQAQTYFAKSGCDNTGGNECPRVVVDYCVDMYTGEPYNNSTFEQCLTNPNGTNYTESDNNGGREIYSLTGN